MHSELRELSLQLIKLFCQLILVFATKITNFHLSLIQYNKELTIAEQHTRNWLLYETDYIRYNFLLTIFPQTRCILIIDRKTINPFVNGLIVPPAHQDGG